MNLMRNIFLSICTLFLVITSTLTGFSLNDLKTLTAIDCEIKPFKEKSPPNLPSHSEHGTFTHLPYTASASLNWSGYASLTSLHHPKTGSVTNVQGSWTVPALSPTNDDSFCFIWAGIDGYSSPTVEQIGTGHLWINGSQQNFAWFEMFPNGLYEIVGFPVDISDKMGAVVSYEGSDTFLLILINFTKNIYTVIPTSYTKMPGALRSSAEWIIEAPSVSNPNPPYYTILPLANFGTVEFSNCKATINGDRAAIDSRHWKFDPLTMVTEGGDVKSIPSSLSPCGESFSLTWEHE